VPPIRPVEPVPPYERGPMPPRTSPFALFGIGAVALGITLAQVLPLLLLSRYLVLIGVACGLLGAALGLAALGQIARFPKRIEGRPMAIAAVVLGLLEALGYLAIFLLRDRIPFLG
jgi:hypothetical protein